MVTAASSTHNIAVRRAADGKHQLPRQQQQQQQPAPEHSHSAVQATAEEDEEDGKKNQEGAGLERGVASLPESASREQLEQLLRRASDAQLGALCDTLSVRGGRGLENKRRAALSAWDSGFPNYTRLAVDAWLAAIRKDGGGTDAAEVFFSHPDAPLLRNITASDGRRTHAFNGDGLLANDLEFATAAVGPVEEGGQGKGNAVRLLRFVEPAVQVLAQGRSEMLAHGDVLALLATPAVASAEQAKQLELSAESSSSSSSKHKLSYEYTVVNRKHNCLVAAPTSVWVRKMPFLNHF
eukprot:COSAG06_NODE_583_length_14006_cov_10.629251_12_plen_295_part_00